MASIVKPQIVAKLSRTVRDPQTNGTTEQAAVEPVDIDLISDLLAALPDGMLDRLLGGPDGEEIPVVEGATLTIQKVTDAEIWVRAK